MAINLEQNSTVNSPAGLTVDCLERGLFLQFQVDTINSVEMMEFQDMIRTFCVVASLIMMGLIYYSVNEVEEYFDIYIMRYSNENLHG